MKQIALPTSDDRLLWDVWMSAFQFPALTVADELGLFHFLEKQPATAQEIADSLSLSLESASALLGVMASLGFLGQQADTFSLTELSRVFLLPDSPYYWGAALRIFRQITATYDGMRAQLQKREGATSAPESEPEDAPGEAGFTYAMHSLSFPAAMVLALRGDFQGVRRFLDVGGGSGSYCIALALRHPDIHCTVLETPAVSPVTRRFVAEYGLEERVDVVTGDMYARDWPAGYDVHFLSNVIHVEDRSRCLQLARSSYAALAPGGRLWVHEVLLNDTKDGPLTATSFSLAMRFFNGRGGQRTAGEIESILRDAGFGAIHSMPSYGYYSLVSGTKT